MVRRILLAAVLAFPATALAEEAKSAEKPQYAKEMDAVGKYIPDCYGGKEDAACAAIIAGYERAMKAPDAGEDVKHGLFGDYLHTIGIRASGMRERGQGQAALDLLIPAYFAMIDHADGVKHFHTLIENIPLVREVYLALATVGRQKDGDQILTMNRGAVDSLWRQRESFKGNKAAEDLLKTGLIKSEERERIIGEFHEKRAAAGGPEKAAERDRAIDSYQRSELWLERATDTGINAMFDGSPEKRYVNLKLKLGKLLLDRDDKPAASKEYLLAASLACRTASADDRDHFLVEDRCDPAVAGWMLAEGVLGDQDAARAKIGAKLKGMDVPTRYINRTK